MKKKVWKLEFRGYGVEPYNFANKQAAEDFAAACFWRGGRQYRIYWVGVAMDAVVYNGVGQAAEVA